ncbi:hypothetical protein ALI22I_42680 [Saccharothrix sp. ALI-22-I]|uniref:ABC transporter substrate-binding protein n=1 Tax=Saccharothrix sp. ALI-22-I TaxID=1933778 RepID=UPI00097C5165|nr:extracellular solute-binding protein [Saccharothrix sp. ALI-22-I]ONI80126.1 hypothetical protein ALI22I_42680 [Saccharothrix sp. ALI-22-I]
MRNARTRWATAVAGVLTLSLAACGGGATGETEQAAAPSTYSGEPVTIEFWGSNQYLKGLADEYNKRGGPITVTFTQQQGNPDLHKALRNAHAAGGGPCVFDTITETVNSLASDGIVADISQYIEPYKAEYTPIAWEAARAGDRAFGLPAANIPNFMLYNAAVFQKAGVQYPTTWEEFIEAGKKLNAQGVKIFNLAGEDYTTYVYLAWQAGARWWQLEGDGWKVDVDSADTKQAADVLQQLIDNDLVEKISYAEFAAMMQQYNAGNIAARQLSTWQTKSMQKNLTTGLGQWEPAPNVKFAGEEPANVSFTRVYSVNTKCANPAAAVEFAHWASTDKTAISLIADPEKGSSWFPAVADPAPYTDISKPVQLIGAHADKWQSVVTDAVKTQKGDWQYGPNSQPAFEHLADLWGKAVDKQIKVADIAPEMQKWIVDDLRQSGITVVE